MGITDNANLRYREMCVSTAEGRDTQTQKSRLVGSSETVYGKEAESIPNLATQPRPPESEPISTEPACPRLPQTSKHEPIPLSRPSPYLPAISHRNRPQQNASWINRQTQTRTTIRPDPPTVANSGRHNPERKTKAGRRPLSNVIQNPHLSFSPFPVIFLWRRKKKRDYACTGKEVRERDNKKRPSRDRPAAGTAGRTGILERIEQATSRGASMTNFPNPNPITWPLADATKGRKAHGQGGLRVGVCVDGREGIYR
ncbi:hypothetical protein F4818DRAFT_102367 [Hypoxylon cercidicola]|nr:hypothetical protein F4818DRAFT_102367 [Hypoxylon cercidicola]